MVDCHDQKTKFFLILKLSYVYCTYPYVHCWIHDMEQKEGGGKGDYFKKNIYILCQEIVISYNMMTNLLTSIDDDPICLMIMEQMLH
jgi:hypothetical protein